jgi:hypothetical protein
MVKKLIMKPLGENVIEVQVPQGTKKEIEAGEVLAFKTTVTIGPKFSHLFFERSPAENVQIENPFLGQSCLVSEKQVGEISPDLVQTRQRSEYILNVDFGKVSFRPTFACIWRAAFERSRESSAIEAPIKIRVPRQNFRLSPEFVNEYTASNEAEAKATGKIAGLQHLPEFLAPAETTVPVRIPMQVVVMYPFWPALVVFGGGLGLLVALVFLVGAIAPIFSASMKVSACDESDRRLPAGVRSGAVLVSGHIVGRVAGTLFTPAPGVDLEGGTENASIAMPIMCTLADGSRIKLIFGERSKPSGRQPAAASGERDGGTEGPLERL